MEQIEALGVKPVLGEYMIEEVHPTEGLIARHDTHRVAHDLLRLMMELRDSPVSCIARAQAVHHRDTGGHGVFFRSSATHAVTFS